jgi:hypothetical protein
MSSGLWPSTDNNEEKRGVGIFATPQGIGLHSPGPSTRYRAALEAARNALENDYRPRCPEGERP